ncbi:MAG: 3'-5' exonuclease [Myxococcota bacterium]|nr:3'-5' exonuclease [Myxococcota bacterium]
MTWTSCRFVAFDTETTGLRAYQGDRIIEFGAVEFFLNDNGDISQTKDHQWLINPGIPIPREASKVSGIYDEDVASKPSFESLSSGIWELLSDAILVAHNFNFDMGFLRSEFARVGRLWPKTRAELDTLTLGRSFMKLKSYRLEKIAGELGVSLDNAHRAVHDARACGEVFLKMTQRYEAPQALDLFMDWAIAVGPPPQTGQVAINHQGLPEFLVGPHEGVPIEKHPDYVQWMTMARQRKSGAWIYRYPESFRLWATRWLRARTADATPSAARGGGQKDWNLDPRVW